MGAVVGQQDGQPVGHGRDKMAEKIGGGLAQGLAMKLDEGEFGRAVNGHEEIEPALGGLTSAISIWKKPME